MAMSTDTPLFEGFVDTTMDALRLIEVCHIPIFVGQTVGEADRIASAHDSSPGPSISHQAARRGLIPRVTRRLNDFERRTMVKSGAIFIFSVEESGIKRWTEGLAWSQSRISGNFLVCFALSLAPGTLLTIPSALSGGRGSECSLRTTARGHTNVPTQGPPSGTAAQLQAAWLGQEGACSRILRSPPAR